jgi:hypothetical protein
MEDALREAQQSADHVSGSGEPQEGATEKPPETVEGAETEAVALDQENEIPSADCVEDILRAIEAGKIPIQYNPGKDRTPFAEYSCRGRLITIVLIRRKGDYFTLLKAEEPTKNTPGAPEVLRSTAEKMSYDRTHSCAFERKVGDASIKIQLGEKGVYLVCRRPHKLAAEELAQTVKHLHRNLNRLFAALESWDSGDEDE